MSVCAVGDKTRIKALFDGWQETLIYSCLEGHMGEAYTCDAYENKAALLIVGDFCYFAGEACRELVQYPGAAQDPCFRILVPQNACWERLIEEVYPFRAAKRVRYAIKKEPDVFKPDELERWADAAPSGIVLQNIDRPVYEQVMAQGWSRDLCSQFRDYEDYAARGIGIAALYKGTVVGGASSYTVYDGGIEIEIDTREDYRRRGIATACGARLILECIKRGLYPNWDAQNKWSAALAEKLGYHFDREYTVYELS